MNYTPIHVHTDLSNGTTNIDSVTKYNQYISFAKENNIRAIAFTEHGNVFNWIKKKEECEKNGIKYIHAVETYVTESLDVKVRDNYHCCLYARNFEGFKELNQLLYKACNKKDGHFYYSPRITFDELLKTSDNIIITTACLGGILSRGNENIKQLFLRFLSNNSHRCFLEIQHHNVEEQKKYNKFLYSISNSYNLKLISGTDTHSLNSEHVEGRKVLQRAKDIYFSDEEGWDLTFKTYDELIECYKQQDSLPMDVVLKAIENTNVLADMIEEYEIDKSPKYPQLYDDPEGMFKKKINEGVIKRGINKLPNYKNEYEPRIYEEFEVYKKVDSINYMLLQEKITTDAKEKGGVEFGYGRGSVTGSLIAYLLGITEMDSVKYGLNFYRFMNPDRVSMPDIDGDHGDRDREWVMNYIFNMKGVYTSSIITFNTIALKGAIRDVGRALKISNTIIDEIAKNVDKKEEYYRKEYPELFKYVDIVQGTIVSIGSHPAGIIVSPIPLDENMGLYYTKDSEHPVSMIDMKGVDSLSFVKLDILGLDTISIINETCKLVGIDRITPDNVDLYDEKVWDSIKDDTTNIFQMESEMAHKYLNEILSNESINKIKKRYPNITEFDLFMFINAAIRPAGENFRNDATKGICNSTGIKELDEMLYDTLGYVLLQEQIMQFLVDFCDYSNAESDNVRRAIGKKGDTSQFLDDIKRRFLKYTPSAYNIPIVKATKIIDDVIDTIKSASNYGFSRNHNKPYAITGYVAGYLRHYYPLEFLCSALNVWTRKKHPEDVVSTTEYAQKIGIEIKDPKFRYSKSDYFIDKKSNSITKGIESIKFLNSSVAEYLYSLKDNTYNTFTDLLIALKGHINSKQLDILIRLNFFSEFGLTDKLLKVAANFEELYTKKQFKKEKFDIDTLLIISKFAQTETEKMYKDVDTYALCTYLESQLEDKHIPIQDRVKAQIEYTGSCNITDSNAPGSACIVIGIDTTYSPKITLYNLRSGNTKVFKLKTKTYKNYTFDLFDIILMKQFGQENKKRRVETGEIDKNGKKKYKYEPIPDQFEDWLYEYEII